MNLSTKQHEESVPDLIDRLISPEKLISGLVDCARATMALKNGMIVPDWPVRLEAIRLILSYRIGRPRPAPPIENLRTSAEDRMRLEDRMVHSPELLKSLKDLIARVETRKRAIDV